MRLAPIFFLLLPISVHSFEPLNADEAGAVPQNAAQMEDLPRLKESFYVIMALIAAVGASVYIDLKVKKII